MELCQTEALGMLYHHHGGIRDVHANFNHSRRDQNLNLALLEEAHDLLFEVRLHSSVQNSDLEVWKNFLAQLAVHLHGRLELRLLVLFNHRINHVSLMSRSNLLPHKLPDFIGALIADTPGDDRGAAGRHFVEDADVEFAIQGESKSAG